MYPFKHQTIETSGVIIINTNQNSQKVGRLELPKLQTKKDYFATINESKEDNPVIFLSYGRTQDVSKPGAYIYPIKACSMASAVAQAVKEARRRYLRFHQLSSTTSNIHIHVESTIQQISDSKKEGGSARQIIQPAKQKQEKIVIQIR